MLRTRNNHMTKNNNSENIIDQIYKNLAYKNIIIQQTKQKKIQSNQERQTKTKKTKHCYVLNLINSIVVR